jgi:tyrosinase
MKFSQKWGMLPPLGVVVMHIRQNIDAMSDADIAKFQRAITHALTINDNRGYIHFAGMHGWPFEFCKHGNLLFLPWHRAYLYMFELSLRDLSGDVALPWWDWTSEESRQFGIPHAYADAHGGLANAPVPLDRVTLARFKSEEPWVLDFSGSVPRTLRNPDPPANLPTAAAVEAVLTAPTFADFSTRLEDIHDSIHVWFKTTMASVPLAAFDPIFWAHHAMIDRIWYRWQMLHPGANVPAKMSSRALEGFPLTVSEVLDIASLGYDYSIGVVS